MPTTEQYTIIPAFMLKALQECIDAGVVPSIRSGQGGNSHSTWFVKFTVRQQRAGHYDQLHEFEVQVTSSYSQQFLEFTPYNGPSPRFDGITSWRSMSDCIGLAMSEVAKMQEHGEAGHSRRVSERPT